MNLVDTSSIRAWAPIALFLSAVALAISSCDAQGEALLDKPNHPVEAEDFSANTVQGNPIRLTDFRGQVVFLNFWATWCVPCREEMPAMQRVHEAMKGKTFKMLAVNIQEQAPEVLKFAKELNLTFDLVLDPTGAISRTYGANTLPLTYLIDQSGMIVARAIGSRPWDRKDYFNCLLGMVNSNPSAQHQLPC